MPQVLSFVRVPRRALRAEAPGRRQSLAELIDDLQVLALAEPKALAVIAGVVHRYALPYRRLPDAE